jgi:hypothetical protein
MPKLTQKYKYARKYHRQRSQLMSSQDHHRQREEKTRGEIWGLLRRLLGMAFFATLIGRNR